MASRPKTLAAASAPVIIGTAMAYAAGGFHIWAALAALSGALFIQIGTNFANDFFDHKKGVDQADRKGPLRVTQAGLVTPQAMKRAMILVFFLAVVSGVYLVLRGGMPIVAIGILSILFGIIYTGGPFPLGYHGLGDIFAFVFFGPVAVGGTYYVQCLDINGAVILAGIAPGLYSLAILTVNNLRDIQSDARAGKKTLQVRFGEGFARWEYLLALLIANSMPAVIFFFHRERPASLAAVATIVLCLPAIKKVFKLSNTPKLNPVLGYTGIMLLVYSLLFSIGWII